jgi:leucine dehydrogenase
MMAAVDETPRSARSIAEATGSEGALVSLEHEELVIRRGRRSGVYCAIAVHSTVLGPALGGCRMWSYESSAAGARDALRLSRAMTFKAAAAGLDLGGGKGVICLPAGSQPPEGDEREAVLYDFADAVNALAGSYITAEDVGTSSRDMVAIAHQTSHVVGLPSVHGGSGDPSPFTAAGVLASMRSSARRRLGADSLDGLRIAVVGCGRVGESLARLAHAAGARLLLADIDEGKRALIGQLAGSEWADTPADALLAEADIVAPCALGGAIDAEVAAGLRAAIVCGSANNQLADDGLADVLAGRGILYAPDFIANAGGLMNVAMELEDYDELRAHQRVAGIEAVTDAVYDAAEEESVTPLAAAYVLARRRLDAA